MEKLLKKFGIESLQSKVSKILTGEFDKELFIIENWRVANCKIRTVIDIKSPLSSKNQKTRDFSENLGRENRALVAHQLVLLNLIGKASHDKTCKNLIRFKPDPISIEAGERYFTQCLEMIRSSNSYLLRHIWKIDKNLGLKLSTRSLRRLISEIIHDLNIGSTSLNLKRKWLQAPAPKCRSLTIPSLSSRVISSMW